MTSAPSWTPLVPEIFFSTKRPPVKLLDRPPVRFCFLRISTMTSTRRPNGHLSLDILAMRAGMRFVVAEAKVLMSWAFPLQSQSLYVRLWFLLGP